MKQGTATKKSGTIAYQLYERNDLTGKSTKKNPTMGVSVVSSRVVTTKEMADDINHASSATQSDVAAVLQAVGQRIAEALLDAGKTHYKNIPVSRSFLSHANLANHAKTHHFTRVCHPDGYIRAIAMYDFARFARFA